MRAYPATLTPDPDGGSTVTFRDVLEAITEGEPLPVSSEAEPGEESVPLSALGMAKMA